MRGKKNKRNSLQKEVSCDGSGPDRSAYWARLSRDSTVGPLYPYAGRCYTALGGGAVGHVTLAPPPCGDPLGSRLANGGRRGYQWLALKLRPCGRCGESQGPMNRDPLRAIGPPSIVGGVRCAHGGLYTTFADRYLTLIPFHYRIWYQLIIISSFFIDFFFQIWKFVE